MRSHKVGTVEMHMVGALDCDMSVLGVGGVDL